MLHLRLICPPDRTATVCGLLDRSSGVAHVVVFPGAAVRPAGDVIEADLARESVDELRRDADTDEGAGWAVAVDSAVVRAHQACGRVMPTV